MRKAATAHHKVVAQAGSHRALWIGGIAVTALGAAGLAYYLTSRGSSSTPTPALPPAPATTVQTTLTQGHRYTVVFTCPSSTSQPTISGLNGAQIVSTTPSGNGGTIVFDYLGATGSYPITASGCTVNVTDNGVSPLPATGDIYASLSPTQQAAVQQALYAYVSGNPNCPSVLTSGASSLAQQGITSASTLSQATLRQIAVDCYQQANNVGQTPGAGVLDLPTYTALMV
jgi:hypothetical protein